MASLIKHILAAGLALSAAGSAFAFDSASLEVATGNRSQFIRGGLQSNWDNRWWESNGTHVSGYWDLTLTQWRNNAYQGVSGATQNITDIGITPVFRLEKDSKKGLYGEAAIGMHLFSHIYSNNNRQFSTAFQFGDHIGVGYVFDNGWDVAVKVQHFSNGAIKHPNPGANLAVIRVAHPF